MKKWNENVWILALTLGVSFVLINAFALPEPQNFKMQEEQWMKEQIWDLNARYVFVYPHPSELEPGVNLCADVIKRGTERDTVWLMPDHESAGY
jgi:predicted outer membrane lipoprotein